MKALKATSITTTQRLREIHKRAIEAKDNHAKLVATRQRDIDRVADEQARILNSIPIAVRLITKNEQRKELGEHVNLVFKNSEKERVALIRVLSKYKDEAEIAREFMGSSRQYLSAYGVGSPERLAIYQEVSSHKKRFAMLRTLATRAASAGQSSDGDEARKGKILAGVLIDLIDSLPGKERPFDSAELAELCVGKEVAGINGMMNEINLVHDMVVKADRALVNQRESGTDMIDSALKARALDQDAIRALADLEDEGLDD